MTGGCFRDLPSLQSVSFVANSKRPQLKGQSVETKGSIMFMDQKNRYLTLHAMWRTSVAVIGRARSAGPFATQVKGSRELQSEMVTGDIHMAMVLRTLVAHGRGDAPGIAVTGMFRSFAPGAPPGTRVKPLPHCKEALQ